MARNFNNLEIYHLAYDFVLMIYKNTTSFPESENKNITSQIRRATVSIVLNIAEGSAKPSNRQFLQYLNVAYASSKEVEVLLNLCNDLEYLSNDDFTSLREKQEILTAKLFLFLRGLESKTINGKASFYQEYDQQIRSPP